MLKLAVEPLTLRLRRPLRAAWGLLREREVLTVRLVGSDGVEGRGEAAPLPGYDPVGIEEVRDTLERYAVALRDLDGAPGSTLLDACRDEADLPWALAAVDLALWDRAGRLEGRPVAAMLTDAPAGAVAVNATIGAVDRAGAAVAAMYAARAGFRCVKLKVGLGDDPGRVAAVRAAAGPDIELRLDANGAWEVDEAVAMIEALAPAGLELVEEPVHGLERLRAVRERVPVRIAMDETAAQPGALASGAADAVALKLGRCGGLSGLLAAASLVRAIGGEPYVTSAFDGPIGIAAAVHAAAALAPIPACGLATLEDLKGLDPGPLTVRDGAIAVPRGPGLL